MTAKNGRGLSGDEILTRRAALAAAWPVGTRVRLCEAPARWRGRGAPLVGREGAVVGVTPGQVVVEFDADGGQHNLPPELLATTDGTRGLPLAALLPGHVATPTLPARLATALRERDEARAALREILGGCTEAVDAGTTPGAMVGCPAGVTRYTLHPPEGWCDAHAPSDARRLP